MAKNTMIYFRKNAAWWNWFFILPWRGGSILKNSLGLVMSGNWAALRAFWRGWRDGLVYRLPGKS